MMGHEIYFSKRPEKPPIVLRRRQEPFTCSECGKPGVGPPKSRVHPGACKDAHRIKLTKKSNAKRKALRSKEKAAQLHDQYPQIRTDQRASS